MFVCILSENGDKFEAKYGGLTPELEELHQLLLAHGVKEVTMESTSIYWHPIWRILEGFLHGQQELQGGSPAPFRGRHGCRPVVGIHSRTYGQESRQRGHNLFFDRCHLRNRHRHDTSVP